jgi:dolichyl-phosphate-mannose--protein O-mannosyl transferase
MSISLDDRRTFGFAVLGITVVAAVLRIAGLWSQVLTADDYGVAVSAANYVETGHLGPTMWNHPGLRNLLVHGALSMFGTNPVALKLASVLLGTLTVALVALVARRLLRDPLPALVAAGLLAVDGLHIDFSRQAVHEVYTACFGLAGIWAALRFHDTERWRWLGFAGVFFGLGVASKWGVAFPMLITAAFLVFGWRPAERPTTSVRLGRAALICAVLAVVSLIVYMATFIPVFARGFDFGDWFSLHLSMLAETAQHKGYSAYALQEASNKAYWWFLKPVGYADFVIHEGHPVVFVGLTNPAVWLLAWPAVVLLGLRAYRDRAVELGLPVVFFAASYLPFLFAGRPIWVHSAFPTFSYALIAIAALVTTRLPRKVLWVYVGLVALLAIPLYLLALGKGYDTSWLRWIVEMYRPAADRGL